MGASGVPVGSGAPDIRGELRHLVGAQKPKEGLSSHFLHGSEEPGLRLRSRAAMLPWKRRVPLSLTAGFTVIGGGGGRRALGGFGNAGRRGQGLSRSGGRFTGWCEGAGGLFGPHWRLVVVFVAGVSVQSGLLFGIQEPHLTRK